MEFALLGQLGLLFEASGPLNELHFTDDSIPTLGGRGRHRGSGRAFFILFRNGLEVGLGSAKGVGNLEWKVLGHKLFGQHLSKRRSDVTRLSKFHRNFIQFHFALAQVLEVASHFRLFNVFRSRRTPQRLSIAVVVSQALLLGNVKAFRGSSGSAVSRVGPNDDNPICFGIPLADSPRHINDILNDPTIFLADMLRFTGKAVDLFVKIRASGVVVTAKEVAASPVKSKKEDNYYNFLDDVEFEDAPPKPAPPATPKPAPPASPKFAVSPKERPKRKAEDISGNPSVPIHARTEGATALAAMHHHGFDDNIKFFEPTHTYTFKGKRAPTSVTTVAKDSFQPKPFNGRIIIDQCFPSWEKQGAKCEYFDIITNAESMEEAKQGILQSWSDATQHGTNVHAAVELHMNRFPGPEWRHNSFLTGNTNPALEPELRQLDEWAKWEGTANLIPWRTELCTAWLKDNGECAVAGQCDLLMFDTVRQIFVLADLKCVKGKYSLLPSERGFKGKCAISGPMKGKQESKHNMYSLQLSMYTVMIARSHGWDCGAEMYLLRVHGKDRATFQWTKCTDYRAEAVELLNARC